MAEGGLCDELTDLIECSLCIEACQDPRTLPCGHWYCHSCLDTLIKTCSIKKKFPCPSCRKEVQVQVGGAEAFPAAFIVNKLNEAVRKQKQVANERDKQTMKYDIKQTVKCDIHNKEAELFCDDCEEMLCVLCVLNHEGHDKMSPQQALTKQRDELANILKQQQTYTKRLDRETNILFNKVKTSKQDLQNRGNIVIQKVNDFISQMHTKIDQETRSTIQKCKKYKNSSDEQIKELEENLEEIEVCLQENNDDNQPSLDELRKYKKLVRNSQKIEFEPVEKIIISIEGSDTSQLTEKSLIGELNVEKYSKSTIPKVYYFNIIYLFMLIL